MSRPGIDVALDNDSVLLVPRQQPYTAMFKQCSQDAPLGNPAVLYVDITTVPECTETSISMVDLDLDVLRLLDGSVVVEDEDEFADHQVIYGYPKDIVALAEVSLQRVLADVRAGAEPFDKAAEAWLATLSRAQR